MSKNDIPDAGAIEYAYAQLAAIAGIQMSDTKLILAGDERFFATKRFDRFGSDRYHLHTFANMIGADFRIPSTDYTDLMSVAYSVTKSNEDLQKIFRLMVFNIAGHNRDDHSKNFSFLMDHSGVWRFSPAYDLTFSPGPGGEHSNTIKGEGKNPSIEHIKKVADDFGLKSSFVNEVFDQTAWAISQWSLLCADLDISKKTAQSIQKYFQNL